MGAGTLIDNTRTCFNAPKTWQLGWFPSRQVTLQSNNKYSWNGNIFGTANYDDTDDSEKMLIRLDGSPQIFVSFNRKTGVNSDTRLGGDQVLIHSIEGDPSAGFGASKLLAKLTQGMSYDAVINGQTVPILVEKISSNDQSIQSAQVKIGGQPETIMIRSSSGRCLQPNDMHIGDSRMIQATQCLSSSKSQQWTVDKFGQFKNVANDGCLRKDASSNSIRLGNCATGTPNKKRLSNFAYDGFTSSMMWWKNGAKVMTLSSDNSSVTLINQNYVKNGNMKRQKWTLVQSDRENEISPSKFVIQSMKNDLCLEPANLATGSKIDMKVCTKEPIQSWTYDSYGQIHNDFDYNFCLERNIEDEKYPRIAQCSSSPPTKKQNWTVFAYSLYDSTLKWKNGSGGELTVTSTNEVIFKKRMFGYLKVSQEWALNSWIFE